jgi:hypothetical protein
VALKDNFQAQATLQSIIDNYKGDDDILPEAKQKLEQLSPQDKTEQKPDSDNVKKNNKE